MASFVARLHGSKGSPKTYEAITAVIPGGKLVIPGTGTPGTVTADPSLEPIVVATDAATNVLGVTAKDAVPVALRAGFETGGSSGWDSGVPVVDTSVPDASVTVYDEVEGTLHFTGACAYNARICAAAGGDVRAFVQGTDPDNAVVGRCRQPGGVPSAGNGLARINCTR